MKTVKIRKKDPSRSKRLLGLDYINCYPTEWERQLRDDIDRGYRFFYEQRGMKPPRVSKDILCF